MSRRQRHDIGLQKARRAARLRPQRSKRTRVRSRAIDQGEWLANRTATIANELGIPTTSTPPPGARGTNRPPRAGTN